jgi:hypothetical protein
VHSVARRLWPAPSPPRPLSKQSACSSACTLRAAYRPTQPHVRGTQLAWAERSQSDHRRVACGCLSA